jgi:regulator of sigma E protease
MIITILVFLLILSLLVLIHEAGHYFTAKKCGIKVEEFGFGLPPRLWGKKIGETIYSINWLPIGGFVKLFGEDEAGAGRIDAPKESKQIAKKDLKRAFFAQSVWKRAAVVAAGIIMNTVLAVLIYYVFIIASGFQTQLPLVGGSHTFFWVNQQVQAQIIVSAVSKNSPAEKIGITQFSQIISVNGTPITSSESFSQSIRSNRGKEITIVWKDLSTNKKTSATVIPRVHYPKEEGSLGVAFYPINTVLLSYDTPLQKAFSGFIHPANLMTYNFDVLQSLIGVAVKEKNVEPLSQSVSGPVGIYSVVGTILDIPDAKERMLEILNLTGLLSISLAFFNLLPIPGLDGGRLFFILIEAVTRKKVNQKIEGYAHAIGMIFLIALILLISLKDIVQNFLR